MDRGTIAKRVADNINQLDDSQTISDGRVTSTSIKNKVNDIYREVLFPLFSNKYPKDFEQTMYPQATYTATGVVSGSTTGTTLVVSTAIFDNSMEGFYIENPTRSSSIKVTTYTNTTTLTMDSSVTAAGWVAGDTIYVRGNIFALNQQVDDLKEIAYVGIKFTSSDTYFKPADRVDREDVYERGNEVISTIEPKWFLTSVNVSGQSKAAIGFLPFPTSYLGKWEMRYTQVPAALNDADTPILGTAGIAEPLINGVTAWAFRVLGQPEMSAQYEEMDPRTRVVYPKGTRSILLNYRPKTRAGNSKFTTPTLYRAMRTRQV